MFDSIFESNLVNLLLLDGGLLYFLKGSLTENLSNRHKETVESLQDAEGKLLEAKTKQKDSLRVLAETELLVESIEAESKKTAQQVESNISSNGKEEINRFKTRSKAQVPAMEAKMAVAVAQEYIDEAISIALGSLQNFFQGGDSWKDDLISESESHSRLLDLDFIRASCEEYKLLNQRDLPTVRHVVGFEDPPGDQTEDQMLAARDESRGPGESNEISSSSIGEKKERSPESRAKIRQVAFLSKVMREFLALTLVRSS